MVTSDANAGFIDRSAFNNFQPKLITRLENGVRLLALKQKNLKQAEDFFRRALTTKSDYNAALIDHAIALLLLKRAWEAVPEFQKALQINPKSLKAQANLAAALCDLHRYPEACEAWAHASELSPDDPDLRTNLGLALQKAGRASEAQKALAEAEKLRTAQKKAASSGTN